MPKKKKVVLLQGSFDILNAGHVMAIKRAKELGDVLIIALNTDELYKDYKGEGLGPIIPFRQRKIILESIKWIDKIVPAQYFSPLELLKKYNVSVYVLTREWQTTKDKEIAYIKNRGGQISWSPRYKNIYCSSDIRRRIMKRCLASHTRG